MGLSSVLTIKTQPLLDGWVTNTIQDVNKTALELFKGSFCLLNQKTVHFLSFTFFPLKVQKDFTCILFLHLLLILKQQEKGECFSLY